MGILGVFVCWRALVRVTSQTAAPTATATAIATATVTATATAASLKLFRGACVLFLK